MEPETVRMARTSQSPSAAIPIPPAAQSHSSSVQTANVFEMTSFVTATTTVATCRMSCDAVSLIFLDFIDDNSSFLVSIDFSGQLTTLFVG